MEVVGGCWVVVGVVGVPGGVGGVGIWWGWAGGVVYVERVGGKGVIGEGFCS